MSYAATIKTLLAADGTLAALLTGGVYAWEETKRLGLSVTNTPTAFSSGVLQPCAIVRDRATVAQGLRDEIGGYATARTVCEVWIYSDGNTDGTTIRSAQARARALLSNKQIADSFQVSWVSGTNPERDPALNEALYVRDEYAVYGEVN